VKSKAAFTGTPDKNRLFDHSRSAFSVSIPMPDSCTVQVPRRLRAAVSKKHLARPITTSHSPAHRQSADAISGKTA